jgi:hypothetical protein
MKILDGPIKASSRGGYYKDIETYGIVKITDKGLSLSINQVLYDV